MLSHQYGYTLHAYETAEAGTPNDWLNDKS